MLNFFVLIVGVVIGGFSVLFWLLKESGGLWFGD
jgi:hypothetical protein